MVYSIVQNSLIEHSVKIVLNTALINLRAKLYTIQHNTEIEELKTTESILNKFLSIAI